MGNKWSPSKACTIDWRNTRFQKPVHLTLEKHNASYLPTKHNHENLQICKQQQGVRCQFPTLQVLQPGFSSDPLDHIHESISALRESNFFIDAEQAAFHVGVNVVGVEHYYQWGLDLPRAIRDAMREAMPDFQVHETIAKLRGRNRFPVHGVLYHPKDEPLPQQEIRGFWSDMRRLFCK